MGRSTIRGRFSHDHKDGLDIPSDSHRSRSSPDRDAPPIHASRDAIIMKLADPMKYARVSKVVAGIAALAPFTPEELTKITDLGEKNRRWEPARIAFYQDVLLGVASGADLSVWRRIDKLLSKVRRDLVVRLSKANNYPTARMYIDALQRFDDLTPSEVEQIIASMVEVKSLVGMRLEPRQFLFFRDLLAAYAGQIRAARVRQLIDILKTALEKDPSLTQD